MEAQVDVVNNKWLLSTPTAYMDWVEEADPSASLVNRYYYPFDSCSQPCDFDRQKSYETVGVVELNGGTYKVKMYPETW